MGKIIIVNTKYIKPSQDFLKEDTVKHIFRLIESGNIKLLPPTPIVRLSNNPGEYIAIDGHNLIAVKDYLGELCEIYIAESSDDELNNTTNDPAVILRNKDLKEKYDKSLLESTRIKNLGIDSFKKLRSKYKNLF
jgi:hypothetical protein